MTKKKKEETANDEMYYCSECGVELKSNIDLQAGKCKHCKREERELKGNTNFDEDYEGDY